MQKVRKMEISCKTKVAHSRCTLKAADFLLDSLVCHKSAHFKIVPLSQSQAQTDGSEEFQRNIGSFIVLSGRYRNGIFSNNYISSPFVHLAASDEHT